MTHPLDSGDRIRSCSRKLAYGQKVIAHRMFYPSLSGREPLRFLDSFAPGSRPGSPRCSRISLVEESTQQRSEA